MGKLTNGPPGVKPPAAAPTMIPLKPDSWPTHFDTTSLGRRTWTIPATINAKNSSGRISTVKVSADFIPMRYSPFPLKYPTRRSPNAIPPIVSVGINMPGFLLFLGILFSIIWPHVVSDNNDNETRRGLSCVVRCPLLSNGRLTTNNGHCIAALLRNKLSPVLSFGFLKVLLLKYYSSICYNTFCRWTDHRIEVDRFNHFPHVHDQARKTRKEPTQLLQIDWFRPPIAL